MFVDGYCNHPYITSKNKKVDFDKVSVLDQINLDQRIQKLHAVQDDILKTVEHAKTRASKLSVEELIQRLKDHIEELEVFT